MKKAVKRKRSWTVFAYGWQGVAVLRHCFAFRRPVELVVVHVADDWMTLADIKQLCKQNNVPCVIAGDVEGLKENPTDAALLAWWPDILTVATLVKFPAGVYNLHPSYLPFGRGKHAYYWSIVHGEPFGVSIHQVIKGIDTGAVAFQREIPVDITDTGETLYKKGIDGVLGLFYDKSEQLFDFKFKLQSHNVDAGSSHFASEIERNSEIFLDGQYTGAQFIDAVRARTFWNGVSGYFVKDGKRYTIRIKIQPSS